jgi:hypothetical protein
MASNPNKRSGFRGVIENIKDRPVRSLTALGLAGSAFLLAACDSGEAQAQKPPVTASGEVTPGATPSTSATETSTPAPTETEKVNEAIVGAIDTTGLSPAAVEYAKRVTPDELYAMTPDERFKALKITPEMYNGNFETLGDLEFAQYAAMVGLATNTKLFADNPNDWQAMIDYGNQFMDTLYGGDVAKVSEKAAGQFPFAAMRTYSLESSRTIATTDAAKNVPKYKVVMSKVPKTTKVIGGDIDMSSATVEMRIKIDAPVDFSALPNDPNIADPNSPAMGDGLPTSQEATLAFSGVKVRDGEIVPKGIVLSN